MKPSFVAGAGFFGVVLVFVAVLSIRQGFSAVMANSGSPLVAYVSGNSTSLDSSALNTIRQAPGVAHGPHGPLVTGALSATARISARGSNLYDSVNMRGVGQQISGVWPDFHIIKGRMFKPGVDEIIVGKQAERLFPQLAIGQTFDWNGHHWRVVGIFAKGGGVRESEIWTSVSQLQAAYNAVDNFTLAYVRLISPGAFPGFKRWLDSNPQLNVTIEREDVSWMQSAHDLDGPIALIGGFVTLLMAIGAIFSAINVMYANVASRLREIATLRALGFSRLPILVAIVVEGVAISIVGGGLAAIVAYLVFNDYRASTSTNGAMVGFSFLVTPELIVTALVFAIIMGLVGGIFPAIRASRLVVAEALREI